MLVKLTKGRPHTSRPTVLALGVPEDRLTLVEHRVREQEVVVPPLNKKNEIIIIKTAVQILRSVF